MLTHISITMWCQWSVCEASCCLVTVLQQQRQCLCLYVSSSRWWVSARLSHCCRHVCCLETILLLTRIKTEEFHPQTFRQAPELQGIAEPSQVLRSQHAPLRSRMHWPRWPVVTPPINLHWLTSPAMTPALWKHESLPPPFPPSG